MSTGSAQQTSTTTAGVSPFAQNYVDAMLGAAQQQVFNMSPGEGGKMNITGIKPYVPFGAPMDAQGNVVPYGGQPQGMGWGAYPQRTPGAEPFPGYGQQPSQAAPYTPPGNQNFMSMFDSLRSIGNRAQQPYTPVQQQNYGDFGFDQNVTDYLNKQRQASAADAGVNYDYDPATKTFKGYTLAGPVTKTLEQIQQEASGQGKPQAFTPIPGQLGMGAMPGAGGGPFSMVYTPEQARQDAYLESLNPYARQQREAQMRSMERQLQGQRQYSAPQLGGTAPGQEQPSPYTPTPQQDFGTYGFDQNVTDYLNKSGTDYTYNPANKTFTGNKIGGGTFTKTLDEIKQEADIINPANVPPPPGGVAVDPNDRRRTADGNYFFSSGQWWPNETVSAMGSLPANYEEGSSRAQQYPQYQQPSTGYPTGTMQAGMGPGEQLAARSSVAGPSGLQRQAYRSAARMQTPGQYGEATDIGRAAGLGLLNTAGQAQGLQSLAQQAIQQGRQYGQDITDPSRTQAFMDPFLQNVVNKQQREAIRQSNILATQQASQAAKAGAFGGGRAGLLEAERQRNLATQLGDIQAQGLQSAFQNAQQQQLNAQQQAMQGYTTGIQGYGQGIQGQTGAYGQAAQGAGTLSNIGGQQLGAQQSIANLQNTFGQQQQQNQQQIINQAMQNYQLQRMYPQQQMQWLSSMLSGLPVSSTGQITNIPAPSLVSQLGGLGLAGAGAYGLYNKIMAKKGGRIKSDPAGGIASIGLSKALNK